MSKDKYTLVNALEDILSHEDDIITACFRAKFMDIANGKHTTPPDDGSYWDHQAQIHIKICNLLRKIL